MVRVVVLACAMGAHAASSSAGSPCEKCNSRLCVQCAGCVQSRQRRDQRARPVPTHQIRLRMLQQCGMIVVICVCILWQTITRHGAATHASLNST